jgi:hypothetical protein
MSLPTDPPTDPPDQEFDLHLNNGRILEHFHRLGWSLPEQPPPRIYRDQTRFVGTTWAYLRYNEPSTSTTYVNYELETAKDGLDR